MQCFFSYDGSGDLQQGEKTDAWRTAFRSAHSSGGHRNVRAGDLYRSPLRKAQPGVAHRFLEPSGNLGDHLAQSSQRWVRATTSEWAAIVIARPARHISFECLTAAKSPIGAAGRSGVKPCSDCGQTWLFPTRFLAEKTLVNHHRSRLRHSHP